MWCLHISQHVSTATEKGFFRNCFMVLWIWQRGFIWQTYWKGLPNRVGSGNTIDERPWNPSKEMEFVYLSVWYLKWGANLNYFLLFRGYSVRVLRIEGDFIGLLVFSPLTPFYQFPFAFCYFCFPTHQFWQLFLSLVPAGNNLVA